MQDVIVSLNSNVLKVTTLYKNEFKTADKKLPADTVEDSLITNTDNFSVELSQLLNAVNATKKSSIRINFVVEPEDTYYKFVTVNKNDNNLEEKILSEVKAKLDGINLDDLYFSYEKIAPFVYQFVGVKKSHLDNIVAATTKLGVELHSVLPWVLLLPKYVGANTSSIFVCHIGPKPVVVLSEMAGVFFVGSYDEDTPEKLNKLVTDLSIYKRTKPIDRVYTFNYDHLKEVDGLQIQEVEIPNAGQPSTREYEAHLLASYMLDLAPDTINSQANLLTMLPLPVVQKRSGALIPVSAMMVALLLFGGFLFLSNQRNVSKKAEVLGENNVPQNVVSDTAPPVVVTPAKELDRKELVVRIENGSGVNGMAAKTQTLLEKLGYKVLEIDTADEVRDSSLLKLKATRADYKELLQKDLKDYLPDLETAEGIETSDPYDVLIIVGTTQKL
jgi:hypothetical protein